MEPEEQARVPVASPSRTQSPSDPASETLCYFAAPAGKSIVPRFTRSVAPSVAVIAALLIGSYSHHGVKNGCLLHLCHSAL